VQLTRPSTQWRADPAAGQFGGTSPRGTTATQRRRPHVEHPDPRGDPVLTWSRPISTGRARPWRPATSAAAPRRNLDWAAPHADLSSVGEEDALLLADAQTSGGLLVAGEIPGAPVIGELLPRNEHTIVVR